MQVPSCLTKGHLVNHGIIDGDSFVIHALWVRGNVRHRLRESVALGVTYPSSVDEFKLAILNEEPGLGLSLLSLLLPPARKERPRNKKSDSFDFGLGSWAEEMDYISTSMNFLSGFSSRASTTESRMYWTSYYRRKKKEKEERRRRRRRRETKNNGKEIQKKKKKNSEKKRREKKEKKKKKKDLTI